MFTPTSSILSTNRHLQGHLSKRTSSIENAVYKTNTSIELPEEIIALVDNKAYLPKHRKLWREHPRQLLTLIELAATKQAPSRWYAKVTAKAMWERTLKFLAKLERVRQQAQIIAQKLGVEVNGFIYKQVWHNPAVERLAAMAAETGRNKAKYFSWLVTHANVLAG